MPLRGTIGRPAPASLPLPEEGGHAGNRDEALHLMPRGSILDARTGAALPMNASRG